MAILKSVCFRNNQLTLLTQNRGKTLWQDDIHLESHKCISIYQANRERECLTCIYSHA